jgi:hypothetical protein
MLGKRNFTIGPAGGKTTRFAVAAVISFLKVTRNYRIEAAELILAEIEPTIRRSSLVSNRINHFTRRSVN